MWLAALLQGWYHIKSLALVFARTDWTLSHTLISFGEREPMQLGHAWLLSLPLWLFGSWVHCACSEVTEWLHFNGMNQAIHLAVSAFFAVGTVW